METLARKQQEYEAACARQVKEKNFAVAAISAEKAADCDEMLAARSLGTVATAYIEDAAAWRRLATQLKAKKSPASAGQSSGKDVDADGDEWLVAEKPEVTFDDIAGMEDAKRVIQEMIVYPMRSPEKARVLGLNPGGGVLIYGPPGTGKTLIGKAVAGMIDCPFFYASGAQIRSKWYGETEQRMSRLLQAAKARPVAVLFLDEIDSLLPKRTDESQGAADNRMVTQFLSEVGGFRDSKNLLLILGATNKPWSVDEAVFRSGRFDEKVYIGPPDAPARHKILELNLKDTACAANVDLDTLTKSLDSFSGSDVAAVVNAAKRAALSRAIRDDVDPALIQADFDDARARVPCSITAPMMELFRKFRETRW